MKSRYHTTEFLRGAYELNQLPPDEGCEVAFAGRSNAGKSSALNALTQQKNLARTSKTPGRTQMILAFQVEPNRRLVDLPGLGYAKVPEAMRRHWQVIVERYLNNRKSLCGLFLFMDIRHPLTHLDQQLLRWCKQRELQTHILLTKADKLKRGPALLTLQQVRRTLSYDFPLVSAQLFSASRNIGFDDASARLDKWLGYVGSD